MLSAQTTQAINRCTGDKPRSRVFYFSYSEAPNKWAYSAGGAPLSTSGEQSVHSQGVSHGGPACREPTHGLLEGTLKETLTLLIESTACSEIMAHGMGFLETANPTMDYVFKIRKSE